MMGSFHLHGFLTILYLSFVASYAAIPPAQYWNRKLPNTLVPNPIKNILLPGIGKGHVQDFGEALYGDKGYANCNGRFGDKDRLVNPPTALLFLEKDMHHGKVMRFRTTHALYDNATFIPRHIASSMAFSSDRLSTILSQFSVQPDSEEAAHIKKTIKECEAPAEKGELKICATSLESMIDFVVNVYGNNIRAVSTVAEKETHQDFTILDGVDELPSDEAVICHREYFPYPVFYCHTTVSTRIYMLPLLGADGTRANAVAVCHIDTSSWSPHHLAFEVLKAKPGGEPICHLIPEYDVVWTRK